MVQVPTPETIDEVAHVLPDPDGLNGALAASTLPLTPCAELYPL